MLLNKSRQVADKVVANDEIKSETDLLVKQWNEREKEISSRITLLTEVGDKWKNIEEEYRKIENESTRIRDTLINIDQVIRSKNQLTESLATLRVNYSYYLIF